MLFEDFLQNSSSQSLGKFGEFLFEEFCKQEKINCKREHEGGVDFIIKSNIKVDVKAVRHIKVNSKERFRRHNTEKQLPGVHYAYIIFWPFARLPGHGAVVSVCVGEGRGGQTPYWGAWGYRC